VTFRVDNDALRWARARAFFGGSSLNAVIRRFLEEYAAVPPRWMARLPPPWTPENRIRPVMDPIGAGHAAAGRSSSVQPSEVVDSAIAEVLWIEADREELVQRQG
jgi:hypothetical protein